MFYQDLQWYHRNHYRITIIRQHTMARLVSEAVGRTLAKGERRLGIHAFCFNFNTTKHYHIISISLFRIKHLKNLYYHEHVPVLSTVKLFSAILL